MSRNSRIIIRGGMLCDGTGALPVRQDILIENDVFADIGSPGAFDSLAGQTVEADGKWIVPGFIDAHSHGESRKIRYPENRTKLFQGVTTEVDGNCGSSPSCVPGGSGELAWQDLAGYAKVVDRLKVSTNTVALCGHNSIRRAVMGTAGRKADPEEIDQMRKLLENACNAGAAGFTSGLTYFPGKFADTSELTALSSVLKGSQKIYATHMRSEGDSLMEAVEEAITIARAGSGRLQISHLKTIFPRNFNKIGQLLARLEQCRIEGMFLHADRYPYVYSSTRIGQILPAPYDQDTEIKTKLAGSESFQQEIIEALRQSPRDLASTILLKNGKTLSQLAEENGWTLEETGMRVLMDNPEQTAAYLCMSEENMMKILAEPWVCAGSDAISAQLDDPGSQGHPRAVGTFPTFFRKVASITSMQEAVRRMTSLPASIFRIPKRGIIRKGYFADLAVLDEARYESKAGFDGRDLQPLGVSLVMVNGEIAWDAAKPDQVIRAGRFLPVD